MQVLCSENNIIIFNTFLAGISASLIAAAGYVINDYFDIKIDKINRPERPLASGEISVKSAIIYYSIFSIIGLSLSVLISYTAFFIALLTVILLFYLLIKN